MVKISAIDLIRVRVPLDPPYVSANGIKTEYLKTVIRVRSDSGGVGLGETSGSPMVFNCARKIAGHLIGREALDRSYLHKRPNYSGAGDGRSIAEWVAIGGYDIALLDLAGKYLGLPISVILGGPRRREISLVCELSAGPFSREVVWQEVIEFVHNVTNVDKVVAMAQEQMKRFGYKCFKLKSVGVNREWDFRVMQALRDALGSQVNLRLDPNGAYTPCEAINLCRMLKPLGLQWFEDPTTGIEGMRRVRPYSSTRLATNMWVKQFSEIPSLVRMGGIDVIGIDAFHWGGLTNARDAVAVCRAFGLDTFMHCFFDLGITTAANLHLASAVKELTNGVDTCLYLQSEDIVAGGKFSPREGFLVPPESPGLGVEIDEQSLSRLTVEQTTVPNSAV